jgi:formylglycine-generating enzyme required for sulfatase activity
MSEALALELHRLYRDYYARRLEFDDYRYRRALLLDSLREAGTADGADDLTKPRQPEIAILDPIEELAAKPVATEETRNFRWYYVLAACVLVIVAVVFTVTRKLDDTATVASTEEPEAELEAPPLQATESEPEEAEVDHAPDVGQVLIEEFVARQDWRPMSLLEFQDSWTRLPEADRIVAKGAIWFEPMSESLAYQIDEAREFSTDTENDEQLDRLYEFSLRLGLVELVPPGWMPDPEDINRGAASLAPAAGTSELVLADSADGESDDTAFGSSNKASEQVAAQPETTTESPTGTPATVIAANQDACTATQLATRRRNCVDTLSVGGKGPVMRVLPAGEFVMGSDKQEDENPLRSVVVDKPFAISLFEIKAAEFRLYCKTTGSGCPAEPWPDDDMPVVDVSWNDAVAYSQWLTEQTGQTYRLPTEEEWEYAARAGTATAYPYGDKLLPAQARYSSITNYESPLPASDKTTQKNEFGLWHVIGNVREWVDADWSSGPGADDLKVVRGGSFASREDELRSSARQAMPANDKDNSTGFRLLREL